MPTLWVPALLRTWADGADRLDLPGDTVRAMLAAWEARLPGVTERVCADGELRPGLAVVVGAHLSRAGLDTAVSANDEVHLVPAIGGG